MTLYSPRGRAGQPTRMSEFLSPIPLPGDRLRLLSWNIAKGKHPGWKDDLLHLARDRDLVLIQEAALHDDLYASLASDLHFSFSPGFQNRHTVSGVLTVSRGLPSKLHRHHILEPLLRTPKATLITEHHLTGRRETLVIVNIHVVNFTVGTLAFRQQLNQVYETVHDHQGPLLFSGDFNTWRKRRVDTLDEFAQRLNLRPLVFSRDSRRHAFGFPLDHVYYRGMTPVSAHTHTVRSSDHNPILAELAFDCF